MATAIPMIAMTLAGAGAGMMLSKAAAPKQAQMSAPIPLPQPPILPVAPTPDVSAAKAQDIGRQQRAAMSQTIFTSPLGVSGQANVIRKTLLGQ